MDDIKVSGHTDERVFAGDEDDLLVVGRPCGGLDTAVYAADDLDLCQCGDVSVGGEEKKKRRTCGLSSARVAMSPPARMMTSERSSGR